jgi:iron(III) transport system substrate-binding protein
VLKEAPNADGGKAFVEFMLSDNGQKLVANAFMLPSREDYPADPSRTQLKDIKALPVDYSKSIAQREAILGRFSREIAR